METPAGPAAVQVDAASDPEATLVLGHGARGGIDAHDLVALARGLPGRGISVIRVEQPWRVAGRKVASPPPTLDIAWLAVLTELDLSAPIIVGGRSAGARVACRTAAQVGAAGCVALAFPLHPPENPEKSRLPELANVRVPTLVVQGERDAFGGPRAFPPEYDVREIPGADHSFSVAKGYDQAATRNVLVAVVRDWILAVI